MVDPDLRFPEEVFKRRAALICQIADQLKTDGVLDRLIYIHHGDGRTRPLLKRYVGRIISETHDCYGCGLVSYLYGLQEARMLSGG